MSSTAQVLKNWDWDKLQEKRERQQKQRPPHPERRLEERDEYDYDDERDERHNRRSPFGGEPRGGLPGLPRWQIPNGLAVGGGLYCQSR